MYDTAKYHSSFHLKKWIRSRETGLQILAMAAMFARNFFSRERCIVPSHAYKGKEILFSGTEILQKKSGKSRISAGEIPKRLRQDWVANPIEYKCWFTVLLNTVLTNKLFLIFRVFTPKLPGAAEKKRKKIKKGDKCMVFSVFPDFPIFATL